MAANALQATVVADGPATDDPAIVCTAFQGTRRIAEGRLEDILPAVKAAHRSAPTAPLLVFEAATGRLMELDLRDEVSVPARGDAARASSAGMAGNRAPASATARGAGRPRLGVVAREVTLLPRHWEWLNRQPGGASVTLRKLVEEARRGGASRDRVRNAQEVTYRFLLAMAGDLPGYEEAMRALFAGRRERFEELLAAWPPDVRDHALRLAVDAFPIAG
jgi:hypothetical protein